MTYTLAVWRLPANSVLGSEECPDLDLFSLDQSINEMLAISQKCRVVCDDANILSRDQVQLIVKQYVGTDSHAAG